MNANDHIKHNRNTPSSHHGQAEIGTDKALFWVSRVAARRVLIGLHLIAAAAVLIEWLLPFDTGAHAVERVHALDFTGSYAVYGFVSCVILVLLGLVLRRIVMRRENFYREEGQ
jgi:hypothetical protein